MVTMAATNKEQRHEHATKKRMVPKMQGVQSSQTKEPKPLATLRADLNNRILGYYLDMCRPIKRTMAMQLVRQYECGQCALR